MGVSKNGGGNCIALGGSNSELKVITPPSASPAEAIKISPENLEIANAYLQCQNLELVSRDLSLPMDMVTEILARKEVRAYVDMVFLDFGFNNRFKMRAVMDAVINKKLEMMDEADVGSDKDIIDIMALSHKMSMDILDRQIKLEEAKAKNAQNIKNQTNIQVNGDDGSKYQALIQKLMGNT